MRPEISIVVPVYNAAMTISRCVESIIAQTFADWELLLIDDGSVDDSLIKCKDAALKDRRIRALSQSHLGVAAARNLAIDNVNGKYICFVDADDTIEPEFLQSLYHYHDYDMVICGFYTDLYSVDNQLIEKKAYHPSIVDFHSSIDKEALMPLFMSGMININCNKLLHASIINNNRLRYNSVPINEDYLFMVDYLSHCSTLKTIPEPLYHWIHVENVRTGLDTMPDNILEIYNKAQQKTREFFDDNNMGDVTQYHSYCTIIHKYFNAYNQKLLTYKELNKRLRLFHDNEYVRSAFSAYKPKTNGELFMYSLLKYGFFHLYFFVYSHYDLLKSLFKSNNR